MTVDFEEGSPQHQPFKRYAHLHNIYCLSCEKWMAVTGLGGYYTGVMTCGKCGARNVFDNSLDPISSANRAEGRQG